MKILEWIYIKLCCEVNIPVMHYAHDSGVEG